MIEFIKKHKIALIAAFLVLIALVWAINIYRKRLGRHVPEEIKSTAQAKKNRDLKIVKQPL